MACCALLLVRCRRLQRSAKCKYTHYRSTYCLFIRGADVTVWDSDPWKSRVWAFAQKREITGEPLNSRSRILAPKWREITGVDCTTIIRCKPDISRSCISRNWIYRGRMLDPIFCPPITRILQTWHPRAQYFSRNRGNSLHSIRGRQFFAKSAHRDSLCSCSLETIFCEINSSLYLSMRAGTHAVQWAATLGGALTPVNPVSM